MTRTSVVTIELLDTESATFLKWKYSVTLRNSQGDVLAVAYSDNVLTASLIANALSPNVEVAS